MIFLNDLKKAHKTKAKIIITNNYDVKLSCVIKFLTTTHVFTQRPEGKFIFFDTIKAVDFE